MDFFVYSRGAIERLTPHEVPHAIVSITTTEGDVARLPTGEHCRGVLRVCFLDADAPSETSGENALFSREHARRIWEFVRTHAAAIERLVVHCDAGMCRSPAVAAAIAKALGQDDAPSFARYRPNARVYRTLLETWFDEYEASWPTRPVREE